MLTLLPFLVALLVSPADTTDERQVQLDAAIRAYVRPFDRTWDPGSARVAWVDLNGDRLDDALVLVEDPDWCGSGGCTLLIFEQMNEADAEEMGAFRPAAEINLVHGPVHVSRGRANQWRDILVRDQDGRLRTLRFNGETYPFSPAEGRRLRGRASGVTTLFADGR